MQTVMYSQVSGSGRAWFHMPSRRVVSGIVALVCIFCATLFPSRGIAADTRANPAASALEARLSLAVDAARARTVLDMAGPEGEKLYAPFVRDALYAADGALWLRFRLNPGECAEQSPCRLTLGGSLAGATRLFVQQQGTAGGSSYWQAEEEAETVSFALPADTHSGKNVYVRLDAAPGLWFRPGLEPGTGGPPKAIPPLVLVALLAASALMLALRALREKAQWRAWSALLTCLGLFQSLYPPQPVLRGEVAPLTVASLMAPGFILMLLPHIGRHLVGTPWKNPRIDRFLMLCPLLGALAALAPLVPQYSAYLRFLPFWPVLALPMLLLAASLLGRRQPGAFTYFAATLMPVLGAAASLFELQHGAAIVLGAKGALWGLAVGALALALAPAADVEDAEAGISEAQGEASLPQYADPGLSLESFSADSQGPEQDDARLRLDASGLEINTPPPGIRLENQIHGDSPLSGEQRPVGEIPGIAAWKPGAAFNPHALVRSVHDLVLPRAEAKNVGISCFVSPGLDMMHQGDAGSLRAVLLRLLHDAVDCSDSGVVQLMARSSLDAQSPGGLSFSVTCAPGKDAPTAALLTNMAQTLAFAEQSGGYFSMERTPQGAVAVFFSVMFPVVANQEADAAVPASELAAPEAPAPELAAPQAPAPEVADLEVATPEAVAPPPPAAPLPEAAQEPAPFASPSAAVPPPMPLPPPSAAPALAASLTSADWLAERIIVADMAAGSRKQYMRMLSALPHERLEATDAAAAVAAFAQRPCGIVLFDGGMPEADIAASINDIRNFESDCFLPRAAFIALAADVSQAERLLGLGCSEVLLKPVHEAVLTETVAKFTKPQGKPFVPVRSSPPVAAPLPPLPPAAPPEPLEETPAPPAHPAAAPAESLLPGQARDPDPADGEHAPLMQGADEAAQRDAGGPVSPEERPLPLLDMIVTDEEPPAVEPPAPQPSVPKAAVTPEKTGQPAAQKKVYAIRVGKPSDGMEAAAPARRENAPVTPAAPEQPDGAMPAESAELPGGAGLLESAELREADAPPCNLGGKIALAGVNDSVNADLVTLIPGLLYTLSDSLGDAVRGKEEKSALAVQQATGFIAGKAEIFGLAVLERMARCVERAAAAGDMDAVTDLLGELETLVPRYQEALRICHQSALQNK